MPIVLRMTRACAGITAGYHRLWSHRAYSATWPLRVCCRRRLFSSPSAVVAAGHLGNQRLPRLHQVVGSAPPPASQVSAGAGHGLTPWPTDTPTRTTTRTTRCAASTTRTWAYVYSLPCYLARSQLTAVLVRSGCSRS